MTKITFNCKEHEFDMGDVLEYECRDGGREHIAKVRITDLDTADRLNLGGTTELDAGGIITFVKVYFNDPDPLTYNVPYVEHVYEGNRHDLAACEWNFRGD
jgi:hypothetical protein